jgi:hypothetical protein
MELTVAALLNRHREPAVGALRHAAIAHWLLVGCMRSSMKRSPSEGRTAITRRRCRGYASALVADLTRDQLDRGRAFAYLSADRTNPTSNSIYQKIGYRRVAESDELWLE